jgi:hypothetical protein
VPLSSHKDVKHDGVVVSPLQLSLSVTSSFILRMMSNTLICPMYSKHYLCQTNTQAYLVCLIAKLIIFLLIVNELDLDYDTALGHHLLSVVLIALEQVTETQAHGLLGIERGRAEEV